MKTISSSRKYIFVVGGVISGVGKGVTASSIGRILENRGFAVTAVKIDPYVNVDAGTMNPTEHGEVFVLDDGFETDQDMGNYERFLHAHIPSDNYMTTGRVYQAVIDRERNLGYGGRCVQVVPHVPCEVVERIKRAGDIAQAEVVIIEIGGTIGEYENILFLEAARMMKLESPSDVMSVMVSFLPAPASVGEMKTKPTQHAVRTMRESGISPDVIIARSREPMDTKRRDKLAFFCNLPESHVISAPDVSSIYDIPERFEAAGVGDRVLEILGLSSRETNPTGRMEWERFAQASREAATEVKIAIVGKYFATGDFVLSDAYLSVIEALKFSAYVLGAKPVLHWLHASHFEHEENLHELDAFDGIVVPGGFGETGIAGKLNVIRYAREHQIPYFGLCYGMQLLVIEFARTVVGLEHANTVEIDSETPYPIIHTMESQKRNLYEGKYGGTMRLGAYPASLTPGTIAYEAYGTPVVTERHRHRYEVNNEFVPLLEEAGLVFSGTSPDGQLMEIAELPHAAHPFFVGVQFHPEFLARPLSPHPLFTKFVETCITLVKKQPTDEEN